MGWEFNAFAGLLEPTDGTSLKFAAGPDMPAGYQVQILGTGLAYDNVTKILSGTITQFALRDSLASNTVQTIDIAPGDQATLALSITNFLQFGLGMVADTFGAWNLPIIGVDHLGNAEFGLAGASVKIELLNDVGSITGYLLIEGTDLFDATLSQSGMIAKITHLDANGDPVPGDAVADYTGAERKFSAFEYAILSLEMPNPNGGIQGNDEVLYPVMVAGDNTITVFGPADGGYHFFDGGTGTDTYEFAPGSDGGGQVDYDNATGGVTVDMGTSTSSGPDGSDIWDENLIGGLGGSRFNDTLTGGALGSAIFGRAGNDTIGGKGGTDVLDGGAGDDNIEGGLGSDYIFGGTGDDDIHGDLSGDPGIGTDDVLVYLHIGLPPGTGGGAAGLGQEASSYLGGIVVTLTADGEGTVTGNNAADGIGLDNFAGVEQVWGTENADTFGVSGTFASDDIAMYTGMGGADTFTGGVGKDIVNYDNEIFSATIFADVMAGTFNTGVTVNMSAVTQFGVLAGKAIDTFGDTDTLTAIDDIHGTAYADILIGSATANELVGKEGIDYLDGGLGNDRLFGGAGNDTYVINAAGDVMFEDSGIDTVRSTITKTLANGFENLTLLGTAGLNGTGNSAANVLIGNSGINKLTGANGRDTLTGGGARDIFDFNTATESGKTATTRDKITDFVHNIDDIDLSTIDANGTAAGNTAFTFLAAANATFTGAKGVVHWFQINAAGTANDKTIIEGDINGDKKADFQIELTGLKVLTAGDFVL